MAKNFNPLRADPWHDRMMPRIRIVTDTLEGTDHMRRLAKVYLPKHYRESDDNYKMRTSKAVLVNVTEDAIQNVVSRPFAKTVMFSEDAPDEFLEWADDIDREGSSLHQFCRETFELGIQDGVVGILNEYVMVKDGATLGDEQKAGARPYLTTVPIKNLIAANWDRINGELVCIYARIRETVQRRDAETHVQVDVERVRILTPGKFEVYEKVKKDWIVVEEGTVSLKKGVPLDRVPLHLFRAGVRKGVIETKPPFIDMAYNNIKHFQVASNYDHIEELTCFPILYITGVQGNIGTKNPDGSFEVGPDTLVRIAEANGKLAYAQPDAGIFETLQTRMNTLLNDCRMMGLDPLLPSNTGSQTATERGIDEARAQSALQQWALDFSFVMDQAIAFMVMWHGFSDEVVVTITINTELGMVIAEADFKWILEMHASGLLSKTSTWDEAKRRGILGAKFDAEGEEELLLAEGDDPGLGRSSSKDGDDDVDGSVDLGRQSPPSGAGMGQAGASNAGA